MRLIFFLFFTLSLSAQKSPSEFNSINDWASWLDANDNNIGIIDTIYDFKFTPLTFHNKVVLKGNGMIKNTFPMSIKKGLDIEGVTFKNSKKWSQYGYVFDGRNLDSVDITLVNVKSSYNKAFLYLKSKKANVYIDSNTHEKNELSVITIRANSKGLKFTNNIIKNNLSAKRFLGVSLGSPNSSGAIINNNHFENIKTGIYGQLFYNLLVEGDSTVLMNNKFIECQVGYYMRGNNTIEYRNTVFNDSITASYMFIDKGANSKGNTIRFENEYLGKAFRVGLLDGIDDQYNYKNRFDITPTDVIYNGVLTRAKGAIRESSTFRKAQKTKVYFIKNSININNKTPYDFLNIRVNETQKLYLQESVKNSLYFRTLE